MIGGRRTAGIALAVLAAAAGCGGDDGAASRATTSSTSITSTIPPSSAATEADDATGPPSTESDEYCAALTTLVEEGYELFELRGDPSADRIRVQLDEVAAALAAFDEVAGDPAFSATVARFEELDLDAAAQASGEELVEAILPFANELSLEIQRITASGVCPGL